VDFPRWDQHVGQEQLFLLQLDMPAGWKILTGGVE